ncbi:hypothetical protein DLD82_14825 [Methanospirillum stamsii]|uniref:Uncharacterized protein n=1 Tax=Methanospirillum stamsii TaxID=1277351 RepID=A0A2V2N3J2_9EURY|nr:hypothetical protein DLD82_14825 [Methanospirillum stamsii]
MPHAITTVASGWTIVPSGLHTWITYQTHQPHQTAQGRPDKPPGFLYAIHIRATIIIHIPPDSIPSGNSPTFACSLSLGFFQIFT